jgi:hypothetical protein
VLQNWRKHISGARGLDPCSSAAWFSGWRTPIATIPDTTLLAAPSTWLARVGWRRHGLLDVREGPRGAPSEPAA